MKYLIVAITLITIVCIATGCGRSCLEAQYSFNIQQTFYPEKDSISIGDTLFLESSHSTTLNDSTLNSLVDFSGSDMGGNLELLRLPDTSSIATGGMDNFNIVFLTGKPSGNDNIPSQNKGCYFTESNNNYELKIRFVAKQKGIYLVSLGNAMGILKKKGGCEKANFLITNANSNNHLYFYANWLHSNAISKYEKTHLYCFKVK